MVSFFRNWKEHNTGKAEKAPQMWTPIIRQSFKAWSLEKEMATQSRILARRTPVTEEPGGLLFTESESDTTEWISTQRCDTFANIKSR